MDENQLSILFVDSDSGHAGRILGDIALALPATIQVDHVEAIEEAIAVNGRQPVDAVLINLNSHDEVELCDLIEALATPAVPVIGLIEAGQDDFGLAAVRVGAQDCLIEQEMSGQALVRSVHNAIERARTIRALRSEQERYELALRASRDGIWDWDLLTDSVRYSESWKSMLGYADTDIADNPEAWFDLVHPGDLGRLRDRLQDHLAGHVPYFECEYRIRCQDDQFRWMFARGLAVRDALGEPFRLAGLQSNITDRKQVELHLQQAALRDPLTGLDNRAQLRYGLEQALSASARRKTGVAVLFLDLDNFKFINDTMGHSAGDHVLRIIARRLAVTLRGYDRIARFGGDEFTILIDDLLNIEQAQNIAQRVISEVEIPIEMKDSSIRISASVGIAVSMTGEMDPEYLLQAADIAMYDAKHAGKSRVSVFEPEMMSGLVERLELERKLRKALDEDRIHLVYQPIVDLETSQIIAIEALARWQDDDGNWIAPATFIPLAEGIGLIFRLGQTLLEQACQDIKRLQAIRPDLGLNVNISSSELRHAEFVPNLFEIISRTGFDVDRLTLEIDESAVMTDALEAIDRLRELKRSGVVIAVDDFGTGHSSLSVLQELPIDVLKIDQSFVQRLDRDPAGFEIVRLITIMAQTLRLSTIAEGIETGEQRDGLRNLGCRAGQGFLLYRPMPFSEIERLIASGEA